MEIRDLFIRDAFLFGLEELMNKDEKIILLTADMGAPLLDPIKEKYPKRFFNMGISEQNSINVAAGLAIEGYKICILGIASFITLRCLEQIKVSLLMNANFYKQMNVTILGVGAGMSYELSGPPHHSIEDVSILGMLPGIKLYYPFESLTAFSMSSIVNEVGIKYARLDSAKLDGIVTDHKRLNDIGFEKKHTCDHTAVFSSGPMVERIQKIHKKNPQNFSLFSFYKLNCFSEKELAKDIQGFKKIIFLEEAFQNKGILQVSIQKVVQFNSIACETISLGLNDKYNFVMGDRDYLHKIGGLEIETFNTFF